MSIIKNKAAGVILLIPIWIVIYKYLQEISDFIVFDLFRLEPEKHLTEAIRFFIFEVPKVLMLLVLIIFAVATGIPVILFAWLIAYTISGVGSFYRKIKAFEYWFRRLVAVLFMGIGLYYIVTVWF